MEGVGGVETGGVDSETGSVMEEEKRNQRPVLMPVYPGLQRQRRANICNNDQC